jgi:hypothetical protein
MHPDDFVRMYANDLKGIFQKGPSDDALEPLTMHVLYNRINHMWYDGCSSTPDNPFVQCVAFDFIIPVEIGASCGRVSISQPSLRYFFSLTEDTRSYRTHGVIWVYVPLFMHWKGPLGDQGHLCILVINNDTMECNFFNPNPNIVCIVDEYQVNGSMNIQLHNIVDCIRLESLLVDYNPAQKHRHLKIGVQTPLQCEALVFLTIACCRRYQFGNPWDIADSIVDLFHDTQSVDMKPLLNWLHWLHVCSSWKDVAQCVGLLRIGDANRNRCSVIVNQASMESCSARPCHHPNTHQHAYCHMHRFQLVLHTWFSNKTFDLWRYVSDDVWFVKTDPLPIGLKDRAIIDVDDKGAEPTHKKHRTSKHQ